MVALDPQGWETSTDHFWYFRVVVGKYFLITGKARTLCADLFPFVQGGLKTCRSIPCKRHPQPPTGRISHRQDYFLKDRVLHTAEKSGGPEMAPLKPPRRDLSENVSFDGCILSVVEESSFEKSSRKGGVVSYIKGDVCMRKAYAASTCVFAHYLYVAPRRPKVQTGRDHSRSEC